MNKKIITLLSLILVFNYSFSLNLELIDNATLNFNLSGVIKPKNYVTNLNLNININLSNITDYTSENLNLTNNSLNSNFNYLNKDVIYRFNGKIFSKRKVSYVKNLLPFPYKFNSSLDKYLIFYNYTNYDDNIYNLAQNITKDSNNILEAALSLARWVSNNIEYSKTKKFTINNITYFPKDEIINSSFVLKSKLGVCDEFTNLFISLCRSVGIPARYISGYAYSGEEFGPHAWAEVYVGQWVPVDPTFGEYGWIDAFHVETSKSYDYTSIIKYSYENGDVNITTPYISVSTVNYFNKTLFNLSLSNDKNEYEPNEYVIINLIESNNLNTFIPTSIRFNPVSINKKLITNFPYKYNFWILNPGNNFKTLILHIPDIQIKNNEYFLAPITFSTVGGVISKKIKIVNKTTTHNTYEDILKFLSFKENEKNIYVKSISYEDRVYNETNINLTINSYKKLKINISFDSSLFNHKEIMLTLNKGENVINEKIKTKKVGNGILKIYINSNESDRILKILNVKVLGKPNITFKAKNYTLSDSQNISICLFNNDNINNKITINIFNENNSFKFSNNILNLTVFMSKNFLRLGENKIPVKIFLNYENKTYIYKYYVNINYNPNNILDWILGFLRSFFVNT